MRDFAELKRSANGMLPAEAYKAVYEAARRVQKGDILEVGTAHGAATTKNTYLGALYRRLAPRRGTRKALVAVGHAILVIVYHVLKRGEPYQDLRK